VCAAAEVGDPGRVFELVSVKGRVIVSTYLIYGRQWRWRHGAPEVWVLIEKPGTEIACVSHTRSVGAVEPADER
jgi:hypothetical protein